MRTTATSYETTVYRRTDKSDRELLNSIVEAWHRPPAGFIKYFEPAAIPRGHRRSSMRYRICLSSRCIAPHPLHVGALRRKPRNDDSIRGRIASTSRAAAAATRAACIVASLATAVATVPAGQATQWAQVLRVTSEALSSTSRAVGP